MFFFEKKIHFLSIFKIKTENEEIFLLQLNQIKATSEEFFFIFLNHQSFIFIQ
jgi:hypothetical protein